MRKILFTLFAVGACGPEESVGDGGQATGQARCADAATEPDGSPHEAEPPPEGSSMHLEVTVEGSGTLPDLDPSCALDGAAGGFAGLYQGEGEVDGDGVYVAALAQGEFTTPSGACVLPELEITSFTSVVLRAELENTQQNCETYCDAQARAAAEEECEGDADQASCRADAEATASGSCTTECTGSETRAIVAETELGLDAVAALNAAGLTGTAVGELNVDLTFDHVE